MYSRGKIYKIVSPSHPDLVYYGSTCNDLYKRLNQHKSPSNGTNSKLIVCYVDVCIVLVENFSCNSKNELCAKEYEYILANKCVNKLGKGFDQKEYRIENKEQKKKYNTKYYVENKDKIKEYYVENKDKIKEYKKEYNRQKITCECGRTSTQGNLARHRKSEFHLKKTPHADTLSEP
jgi:hypothetical protein